MFDPQMIKSTILLGFFLLCQTALAQVYTTATVSGTVVDKETGEPIAGAHAFLGATMIGTTTDSVGSFHLSNVPRGVHTIWISMIGYEPKSQRFILGDKPQFAFDVALEPMILEMDEVTISARMDRRWKKRMKTFERLFLGESELADSVKILNKEALDFDANWHGRFTARASEPILIENQALGYRVAYVLKEFSREGNTIRYDGDPFFEELTPVSLQQQFFWEENRRQAFLGSFKHFLLALLDGTTKEEGFRIKRVPSIEDIPNSNRRFHIDPQDLLVPGEKAGEQLLAFNGVIEIVYLNEGEGEDYLKWRSGSPPPRRQHQYSWIHLTNGPTLIDHVGEIIDPYGVTVYGYQAFERVSLELPKEYRIVNHTVVQR